MQSHQRLRKRRDIRDEIVFVPQPRTPKTLNRNAPYETREWIAVPGEKNIKSRILAAILLFCDICGDGTVRGAKYCPRCRKFIYNKPEDTARAKAMKDAWDPAGKCFRCQVTKMALEEKDHTSPFFLSFDHVIPGKKGELQVVARFINQMKADLSREEFLILVPELGDCIRTGRPFNRDIIRFEYWFRPRMVRGKRRAN
jgi:hypothetical protein